MVAFLMLALSACSRAPQPIEKRDMVGTFYGGPIDIGHGRPKREIVAQFLSDGRFGGDVPMQGGAVRGQGYWRIGGYDATRRCTAIETSADRRIWGVSYCASVEPDLRTALNCTGQGNARTCLMVRRPKPGGADTITLAPPVEAPVR